MKAVILFISALLFILTGCSDNSPPISGKMPPISLPNLEGKTVHIKNYDDDLLLLVFWATWCQPCIMEIPSLVEINAKYKPRGLRLVSILTDNPGTDRIYSLKKSFNINYEILLGNESQFGAIVALPTSFIIRKGGKVLEKIEGVMPAYMLISKIESHLPGL